MNSDIQELDEMLECAVREKGAMEKMKELDRRERLRRRRRVQFFAFGAAACLAAVVCVEVTLGSIARKAGYSFDPAAGQMGGSEITALMREKRIGEAMAKIDEAVGEVDAEIEAPYSKTHDYLLQLQCDREELDFLKAVCLLRKGRYFKGREALREIAEAGGCFSAEASALMENL